MIWESEDIRYVFSVVERSLPLYVDTIGYSAWERVFERPEGYPYYHFLHTLDGEGCFEYEGEVIHLSKGKGVLLTPFTPHSYHPRSNQWTTIYITFGGSAAEAIMTALDMNQSGSYEQADHEAFSQMFSQFVDKLGLQVELTEMEVSTEMYRFLMQLRTFSRKNDQPSLSQSYHKLRPIIRWMEGNLAGNIGLQEIAAAANMGISSLSESFQLAFEMSPYSFLIQLRLREAKKKMVNDPQLALKDIAMQTGFNDVSHFIATFRKKEGLTPGKYRELFHAAE